MLEFDDDSDKDFFDKGSKAGSDDGFAAGSEAEAEAEAESNAGSDDGLAAGSESNAADEPGEAEESDKVVANDTEDVNKNPANDGEPAVAKRTVPKPSVTSEEQEASAWWSPTQPLVERKKVGKEEDKRTESNAGLAGSKWAPRHPCPKDEDSFWE